MSVHKCKTEKQEVVLNLNINLLFNMQRKPLPKGWSLSAVNTVSERKATGVSLRVVWVDRVGLGGGAND